MSKGEGMRVEEERIGVGPWSWRECADFVLKGRGIFFEATRSCFVHLFIYFFE